MTKNSCAEIFRDYSSRWPRRYVRHLFGSVGFFYGPRLFCFVMEDSFCLKVPDRSRRALLARAGVRPFMNAGRLFGRWLEIPFPRSRKDIEQLLPYVRAAYRMARKSDSGPRQMHSRGKPVLRHG